MSSRYKSVSNGKGTDLMIRSGNLMEEAYISIGKDGTDITVRGCGKVLCFDSWSDFISAIDETKAAYFRSDEKFCRDDRMLKVGSIEEKGGEYSINREYYRQGMIFKDEDAYRNRKDEPCYVPEFSDAIYTGNDILNICKGQQEFADELFEELDWQHPEGLMEEWLMNEEWLICGGCGKLVDYGDLCNDKICPNCGRNMEEE